MFNRDFFQPFQKIHSFCSISVYFDSFQEQHTSKHDPVQKIAKRYTEHQKMEETKMATFWWAIKGLKIKLYQTPDFFLKNCLKWYIVVSIAIFFKSIRKYYRKNLNVYKYCWTSYPAHPKGPLVDLFFGGHKKKGNSVGESISYIFYYFLPIFLF